MTGHPAILAEAITMRYPGQAKPVLTDVHLGVEPGEWFGLLGPNGAGKTTLFSLLAGLRRDYQGRVLIQGAPASRASQQGRIGLVPQEVALYARLTVRENLRFFGAMLGLHGERLRQRIAACLDVAQLGDRAETLAGTCSGGMRRRLNLAIGLLAEPDLLFLDEPTVGVDPQSRHLIHQELARLNRQGVTIVHTTHSMEEAQELCTRTAILDGGRIICQGRPNELLQASGHRNLEELFLHLTGRQLHDD
jgi:ABC-2 type transport system ATP-binding protein